jgi:hypothetical protein
MHDSSGRGVPDPPRPREARTSIQLGVRVDPRGEVLTRRGDGDALAPMAAYARRLLELLGQDLGVGNFCSLDARCGSARIILFMDEGDIVAMQSRASADLSALLRRQGLS